MRIVIVDDDSLFSETAEKMIRDFFAERKEKAEVRCCDGCALLKELQM